MHGCANASGPVVQILGELPEEDAGGEEEGEEGHHVAAARQRQCAALPEDCPRSEPNPAVRESCSAWQVPQLGQTAILSPAQIKLHLYVLHSRAHNRCSRNSEFCFLLYLPLTSAQQLLVYKELLSSMDWLGCFVLQVPETQPK